MLDATEIVSTRFMSEPAQSVAKPALARTLAILVERMARGEREALSQLYDATSPLLNGLLVRMLGRAEDAEEILVDVYLHAWKKAESFSRARASVESGLVLIARSMAIDRIRHRKVQGDSAHFEAQESKETLAGTSRQGNRVAAVLRELPAEQREVLELAFFSGLTHSELAARLSQPPGTIQSRIRAALGRLRENLEDETAA